MNERSLNREKIMAELEAIRTANPDGLLYPHEAVAWAASHPDSELHSQIEWDDTKAAAEYRADQVRQIIRVIVVQSKESPQMVRAYISQPSDRTHGGGYRRIEESLARARAELVNEALRKIATMENSFTHLPELSPLFQKIKDDVREFSQAGMKAVA